jgi:energy-coupling factor transport system ATP-binding protein
LKIYDNEVIGIVGSNGCGKSTLLKNIIGLLKPKTGDILFNNESITGKRINEISRNIGYVFQNPDYTLFENTVNDEIRFGANNLGIKFDNKIINNLNLGKIINQDTSNLSLGQKRLVNIATTIGMNPKIIIIDEPDTGLDRLSSIRLCEVLNKINKSGKTIIIVSHNLNFINCICDRVISVKDGKINQLKIKKKNI